jgi:short-subunit dehydrogenase
MQKIKLNKTNVLITGASSGIGEALAKAFAAQNANLILVARREDRLQKLVQTLEAAGHTAQYIVADLNEENAADLLFAETQSRGIEVDHLVNNAGLGSFHQFHTQKREDLDRIFKVNMQSLVHLTHLYTADMIKRGFGGVMQISSNGAFQAIPNFAHYAASKAYVLNFSEAIASELKPRTKLQKKPCLLTKKEESLMFVGCSIALQSS